MPSKTPMMSSLIKKAEKSMPEPNPSISLSQIESILWRAVEWSSDLNERLDILYSKESGCPREDNGCGANVVSGRVCSLHDAAIAISNNIGTAHNKISNIELIID